MNEEYKDYFIINGAKENNLKNITTKIPKNKIVVFTGVSGSGKSSLVFETIAIESQRLLNESFPSYIRNQLPHLSKPNVDFIRNLNVSIVIDQKKIGGSRRSTVGTVTEIYTLLRLLFSRIGKPFVGYSNVFSFNNPEGMCKACMGVGITEEIRINNLIDYSKSLNEAPINFPTFNVGGWRLSRYTDSGLFNNDKKLKNYSENELNLLLYAEEMKLQNPPKEWHKTSMYTGVIPRIKNTFLAKDSSEKKRYSESLKNIINVGVCKKCNGTRLNNKILECKIQGKSIGDIVNLDLLDLLHFLKQIDTFEVKPVLDELNFKIEQMIEIGLAYLSINRDTPSLSGGESQRIKLVKHLGSSLTELLYILDEPSIGLHPYDIQKLLKIIKRIQAKGNSVFIVEHDKDIIKEADFIIDIGPFSGKFGGEIVYEGSYNGLLQSKTLSGEYLSKNYLFKSLNRKPKGYLEFKNLTKNNLKNISVSIAKGCINVITGVAGSGKSSLVSEISSRLSSVIYLDQKQITATKRSNLVTYLNIFNKIRSLFAEKNKVSSSLFSFNSKGACPVCKGLGKIYLDLAYLDTVSYKCKECDGTRFLKEVLEYSYNDKNIYEVLNMTVNEAKDFFENYEIKKKFEKIVKVGLDYLTLGQSLDTLSGGELQRIKLAMVDFNESIIILDEPSTGLHISDIKKLTKLFNQTVDEGNTLIIIEHSTDIVKIADYIIDIGPYAGKFGGEVIYQGNFEGIKNSKSLLKDFI